MQLDDVLSFSEDQNKGAWLDLAHPVTGKPTGMRLRLAGPDSEIQRQAALTLADELAEAMDADGRVSAADRERCRLQNLARCVVDWEITEGGKAVPFTFQNVLRLFRAGKWVQFQADAFAADRRNFHVKGGDDAAA